MPLTILDCPINNIPTPTRYPWSMFPLYPRQPRKSINMLRNSRLQLHKASYCSRPESLFAKGIKGMSPRFLRLLPEWQQTGPRRMRFGEGNWLLSYWNTKYCESVAASSCEGTCISDFVADRLSAEVILCMQQQQQRAQHLSSSRRWGQKRLIFYN